MIRNGHEITYRGWPGLDAYRVYCPKRPKEWINRYYGTNFKPTHCSECNASLRKES